MASPKSRPRDGYPGRALSLILVAIVALVAIMFGTGNYKPRLGIDLAGGTSVTLKATSSDPKAVNSTNMATAVSILQERVNGYGVSEATVQTQGNDTIIVNIPKGTNSTQVAQQLGATAKLYFRPVLAQAYSGSIPKSTSSPSAPGSASPSASASSSTSVKSQASPSASKTQGDAVSKALTAGSASASAKATASAPASAKASATPTAAASAATSGATIGQTGTVPTDLTAAFAAIDCSTSAGQKAARDAAVKAATTANIVSCSQKSSSGVWEKYALGPVAVAGQDLSDASAGLSQTTGQWEVDLSFNGKGTKQFADTTKALTSKTSPQNQFAIVLDGQTVSAPAVNETIAGGKAQITGNFSPEEAKALANVLSYGALPLDFKTQDVTTVSAELGGSQLDAGLLAGAIGLALVVLYSLFYYRGLGLVAVAGLVVSAVLTWSIMSLLGGTIGFALNLPAVCGAIVAIGITADSFVVYFERIRDQLREGSTLRPAVQRAWPRARRTILVSDFVSFLAAAVLYFFTVGKVQGFAFTLGLTTLLDVVVIFLFTKPLITLLARTKFFGNGHKWSGLSPERLGVRAPLRGSRRGRPAATKEA
ncbi:protein translocase subunit SecD [Streptacidiphilus monticola]|uniref:Protein translocase subunit SecD n=1 Tax=Streptacidiphilus monticola TaxID=2161674 RepID=A0ABW1G8I2_9ACTN